MEMLHFRVGHTRAEILEGIGKCVVIPFFCMIVMLIVFLCKPFRTEVFFLIPVAAFVGAVVFLLGLVPVWMKLEYIEVNGNEWKAFTGTRKISFRVSDINGIEYDMKFKTKTFHSVRIKVSGRTISADKYMENSEKLAKHLLQLYREGQIQEEAISENMLQKAEAFFAGKYLKEYDYPFKLEKGEKVESEVNAKYWTKLSYGYRRSFCTIFTTNKRMYCGAPDREIFYDRIASVEEAYVGKGIAGTELVVKVVMKDGTEHYLDFDELSLVRLKSIRKRINM